MPRVEKPIATFYSFEDYLEQKRYLIYTNVGTSMLPLLRQRRDVIEIQRKDPTVRCKKYDVVLYKSREKYILHRVLKVRAKDYIICGDHNIWREKGITDDQILGVMTRVIRDGKSINSTDWQYKIYVHLWSDFYYIRVAILYIKKLTRAVCSKINKSFFGKGSQSNESND